MNQSKDVVLYPNQRKRKDYIFFETTRSLCNTCLQLIDAKIVLQNGKVVMHKRCPLHGEQQALLHSDAEWFLHSLKFNRPGDIPVKHPTSIVNGCPYDCGYCPDHEQHTCLSLVDITDACNLKCPTCFSDSKGQSFLTLDQIRACIDGAIAQEGNSIVIQFSGGEPTLHPQLVDAVKIAKTKPVDVLMINTNGIRLADDEDLVRRLVDAGGYNLEIYLQFDGFSDDIYKKLRGAALYDKKMRAIDNLVKHGLAIMLSCVVKRSVNEHEVGKVVEFGIKTPGIRGVVFQPAFCSGRSPDINPLDRVTNTEVMRLIEEQTRGIFRKTDFVPLPCSYPSQIALTYAYLRGKKVTPIPRVVDVKHYLDSITNTILPDHRATLKTAIEGLWSAGASFNSLRVLWDFIKVCGFPLRKELASLDEKGWADIANRHAFRISVIQFMDKFSFDLKVAKKSCIGQALPDGRSIPFDVYNALYRPTHDVRFWADGNKPVPIIKTLKGPAQ
jgi:7,8-dihydro-6-hydroxymethylpterin dimethyltransferase